MNVCGLGTMLSVGYRGEQNSTGCPRLVGYMGVNQVITQTCKSATVDNFFFF